METRAASNGNSGRVAYIFVVAVVGIMLIVSAIAGVIRLKEAFFAIIQGQAETTESGAEVATSARASDRIAAFYARQYGQAAQPDGGERGASAGASDGIAAFYVERSQAGAAREAALGSSAPAR